MGSCHDWEDEFEEREECARKFKEFQETELWKAAYKLEMKTPLGKKFLAKQKVRDGYQKEIDKLNKQIDKLKGKMWKPKKECWDLEGQVINSIKKKVGYEE